ncbi:hypothetical protein Clacol_006941 [Clathrus columnatus]|uniref:Uncharacterized protein n=1 Tax=Clathrus columnatus TaxID=1419009 RepID=A0AAV5AG54_9AGAM|nr:hypothetical protein Clacol_006941 [Clathrus columnatus]
MSINENEFLDNDLTMRPLPLIRYKFTSHFPGIEEPLKSRDKLQPKRIRVRNLGASRYLPFPTIPT